jgi:hypothetical protein
MTAPQTQGGRSLQHGDSYDRDCWRTSHRLLVAQGILRNLGAEAVPVAHSDKCIRSEAQRFNRVFGFNYVCDDPACPAKNSPTPIWPEWVTGDLFDLAYRLADEYQTEHGAYEQRLARIAKDEAVKAARVAA